ncbi:MAG: dynamin family protein [Kofleriaceae bacterium]
MSLWTRLQRRLGDLAGELVLDDYRPQLNHAQDLLSAGDVNAAIEVIEALLQVKPDHGQALIVLGEARLMTREPEQARLAFERAIAVRSDDPAALVGHGMALLTLARYEPAISSLGRAVAEAGGDRAILAEAYRGLGIAWRRRGDLDKGVRELRKAVAETGDDADARAALGEALIADGGPYDEAMRHLERVASSDHPPAVALYALARMSLLEAAPARAAEYLVRARTAAERDMTPLGAQIRIDVVLAQGDAALAQGDAAAAHTFFLEALAADPRRADVHAKIARAHHTIGNLPAAIQSYDRALALGADQDTLRAAVNAAIAARDATRQLQWGSDLLANDPDDTRALVARGSAMASDNPAAARALLELAASRDDVDAHVALAQLALSSDPAQAARSALAALRVAPRHARAREVLGDARTRAFGTPGPEIAEVADYVERICANHRELGHLVGDVARASANLDQPLLVTVMGEFSSGKSSFVNAFIGADVAPTGITPTTATINVVRYGRERGGRIVTRDGATLELGWDSLMSHLRALNPDAARGIDRVEILVPLPQLEKINIVDTPGLNSIQAEHEATARAFIARADAIVWIFTAGQGGKASEKTALRTIREEGKRVLAVLNKADQLSTDETAEVVGFLRDELGELVETIVPFSARLALAHKQSGARDDGNWTMLASELEQRFFQQARQLKRDACARTLRAVVGSARRLLDDATARTTDAARAAQTGRDELIDAAQAFATDTVVRERKALSEQATTLYRRAAREVLDLVRPRRLPFSSHSATTADRDYLVALLVSGFESAIEAGRQRVASDLRVRSRAAESAARTLAAAVGHDVVGDLERTASDRIGLALSAVFERARAYLRGYLEGGYVEAFFRNDLPRLELGEDAVYHALVRNAPDLDRELAEPLRRAGTDALTALAHRLDHWGGVIDVQAFDLEVGLGRALALAEAPL